VNPLLAREFVAPLRLGNSPHEHAERLASLGPREWEAALDWLDLAGLTLVFWTRLKESGTEGVVPSHLRSRLDRNLADHCLRVTEMATEADTINRCLERAGVDYAVLKGFALVPDYVPDANIRITYDHDYLVSPEAISRVSEALQAAGYRAKKERENRTLVYFRHPPRRPYDRDDLYSPGFPRTVEIHPQFWEAENIKVPLRLPEDPLTRLRSRRWQGLRFRSLGEEDELIFQVLHVFRHILHNWCRLSAFLEIAHFLERRSGDSSLWERLRDTLSGNRPLCGIFAVVFSLATDLFGGRIPSPLSPELAASLEGPLASWMTRYGKGSALNNFSLDKFSLFLHREFVQDAAAWREIRRARLLPLQRPHRAAQAKTPSLASRSVAAWNQGVHVARRLLHHLKAGVIYGWESYRWERVRLGRR